jgi:hypothetical protein
VGRAETPGPATCLRACRRVVCVASGLLRSSLAGSFETAQSRAPFIQLRGVSGFVRRAQAPRALNLLAGGKPGGIEPCRSKTCRLTLRDVAHSVACSPSTDRRRGGCRPVWGPQEAPENRNSHNLSATYRKRKGRSKDSVRIGRNTFHRSMLACLRRCQIRLRVSARRRICLRWRGGGLGVVIHQTGGHTVRGAPPWQSRPR